MAIVNAKKYIIWKNTGQIGNGDVSKNPNAGKDCRKYGHIGRDTIAPRRRSAMKKILILTVLSIATLSLFTACASEADTLVSPSPSQSPMATQQPTQTVQPTDGGIPGMMDTPMDGAGTTGTTGSTGVTGTTGTTNMAGSGSAMNGVTTMDDSRRIGERIADEVEKLSEVEDAEALVADNMAVISVKYDGQYQAGMDDRLTQMIEARVQAVDKNITEVHVVAETGDFDALTKLREKLDDAGFTMDNLRQELKMFTDRVMG